MTEAVPDGSRRRKALAVGLFVAAFVGIAAVAGALLVSLRGSKQEQHGTPHALRDDREPRARRSTPAGNAPRVLLVGGGSAPVYNQISLEEDMLLAQSVFPSHQALFAGGTGTMGVQILRAEPAGDPLLRDLAELFDPRAGRDARYEPVRVRALGAATDDAVLKGLRDVLRAATPREPALMLALVHGIEGDKPEENALSLWADTSLDAVDLAEVLDREPTKPIRLVLDTCYSGGFAELAFRDADATHGPSVQPRCGFFASTHDREATGCDPDPDRRAHESYAIHFLHALRAQAKDGSQLPLAQLDLDGNGVISLLEAHARARIAGHSIDVPTTTSERWLRQVTTEDEDAPTAAMSLPEEDGVIAALAASLGLGNRPERARDLLRRGQAELERANGMLDDANAAEDDVARRIAASLLAHWPVLDDPFHPDFAATLANERAAIDAQLHDGVLWNDYQAAERRVDDASAAVEALELRLAPLERLVRALDTKLLASRLQARGGSDLARYEAFLACERSTP